MLLWLLFALAIYLIGYFGYNGLASIFNNMTTNLNQRYLLTASIGIPPIIYLAMQIPKK